MANGSDCAMRKCKKTKKNWGKKTRTPTEVYRHNKKNEQRAVH